MKTMQHGWWRAAVATMFLSVPMFACAAADESATADDSGEALSTESVNGHFLTTTEAKWLGVFATDVVPRLPGTLDDKLDVASRTAWWALKEGTWAEKNVYGYSSCNGTNGDYRLGPLEICAHGRAWQVGIAAVQVPGHTVSDLEKSAAQLLPDRPIDDLLAQVAEDAGYAVGTATSQSIVHSTDSLRASWLLRIPAIGAAEVDGEVVPECIRGDRGWCYGSGWPETKKFSPTKTAALQAMKDIRAILARIHGA